MLAKFPKAKFVQYEPTIAALRSRAAVSAVYSLADADVIVRSTRIFCRRKLPGIPQLVH